MKKLNITKERFEKSNYFKNKYGKLEYVSESGKLFKTNKGKILKFKESFNKDDYDDREVKDRPFYDIGEQVCLCDEFYLHGGSEDIPECGWTIEDAKEEDDDWKYYISRDDDDDDEDSMGFWVSQDEIDRDTYVKGNKWRSYPKDEDNVSDTDFHMLPWNIDSDNESKINEEMTKYIKSLGDDLLYETLTREPEKGELHRPKPGVRFWSYDFEAALDKATNIVLDEIEEETGKRVSTLAGISKIMSPREYARRLVDCVLEKKPTKTIAKKLAKIGY